MKQQSNYNGIINIYKEKGYTSHDVVAILRKKLNTKKIGHTGTLDPDAEGVLPICIGKATKAVDFLIEKRKVYKVKFVLGMTTDTQDISGTVLEKKEVNVSEEEILSAIHQFIGEYHQIPPMYSALKVNGKKLYELARAGQTIERKARIIFIDEITAINIAHDYVEMTVACSKGTYIRTLCDDIGKVLNTGACMTALTRVASGAFNIENAIKLDEIDDKISEGNIKKDIVPVDSIFSGLKALIVSKEYNKFLYNGNKLLPDFIINTKELSLQNEYRIYDEEQHFIGVYEYIEKDDYNVLKPVKIFMITD